MKRIVQKYKNQIHQTETIKQMVKYILLLITNRSININILGRSINIDILGHSFQYQFLINLYVAIIGAN